MSERKVPERRRSKPLVCCRLYSRSALDLTTCVKKLTNQQDDISEEEEIEESLTDQKPRRKSKKFQRQREVSNYEIVPARATLDGLPLEVKHLISRELGYSDLIDLWCLMQTCKSWYHAVTDDDIGWERSDCSSQ